MHCQYLKNTDCFILFTELLILLPNAPAQAQKWELITEKIFSKDENPAFADDPLNCKLGGLLCMPNGDLWLVRNGAHPVYRSTDQGESWQALHTAQTIGRAYGSFSFNLNYSSGRVAIFMIVQQKNSPARGLLLASGGEVISKIGKPSKEHDGWTWGIPAWEQPEVILS
jgi:hypothetical protein